MKLTDENGKEYEFEVVDVCLSYKYGRLTPIKPSPKKIDMSVCIESGIDCEFSDKKDFTEDNISKLYGLTTYNSIATFHDGRNKYRNHCRPRFNHIHASPTGWDKCPIPEGFRIKVWTHCNDWTQDSDQWDRDTIMIEVISITKGYEL